MPRVIFDDFPTTPNSGPSLSLGTILNTKYNALKAGVNGAATFRLDWANSTAYVANDIVRSNGSFWIALADNTNSVPATANANWAQWQVLATQISNGGGVLSMGSDGNASLSAGKSLSFRSSGTSVGRFGAVSAAIPDYYGLSANFSFNGTNFQLDDPTLKGLLVKLDLRDAFYGNCFALLTANATPGNVVADNDLRSVFRVQLADGSVLVGRVGGVETPEAQLHVIAYSSRPVAIFEGAQGQSLPLIYLRQRSSAGNKRDAATIDALVTNPSDASFSTQGRLSSAKNGALADRLAWDEGAGANTTGLLLFDANSGTLKRVNVGAADSGGAGQRMLTIAN